MDIKYGLVAVLRTNSSSKEIVHFSGYPSPPTFRDKDMLREELETNSEHGLVGLPIDIVEAPSEVVRKYAGLAAENETTKYLISEGDVFKHFKGNKYEVMGVAKHSETEEDLVVYRLLSGGPLWARPLKMFFDVVKHQGAYVPRFARWGGREGKKKGTTEETTAGDVGGNWAKAPRYWEQPDEAQS